MMTTSMSRISIAALVLAASACKPDLPNDPPVAFVSAVFDPTTAKIPLPNDLAFLGNLNAVCPPPANTTIGSTGCAQAELLASFGGVFPNDQEVAVTIDFTLTTFDSHNSPTDTAPDLDLSTLTPSTFLVFGSTPAGQGPVPIAPITASDYANNGDHGTLTIHNVGNAPWPPGSYAVAIRGGDSGVKTTDHQPINASPVFHLVAQGKDMTLPANQGLLKAQLGSFAAAAAQGATLNLIIGKYKAAAYPVIDQVFPHEELAIMTTFSINAATNVPINPARGQAPLPIDLLRDHTTGRLSQVAACTLSQQPLAADGTCKAPAAAGFLALDGFSTTGAILAPTSDLIQAATVTSTSLMLYDLSVAAHPVQVSADSLIIEPCEFTSACGSPTALAPVIAIQPAGASAGAPLSVFQSKPLKDNTDYAVVMTTDIHDKNGRAIGPGTVASVLHLTNPVVVGGKSALQGIDDATAAALEVMRLQLVPVFAALTTAGVAGNKVAMAYTFHTQTILIQAAQLAALPYIKDAATALPIASTFSAGDPGPAFAKYGAPGLPLTNIDQIIEVDITTFNALDVLTGAFLADPNTAVPEQIHVLIATPKPDNASIPDCKDQLAPFGKCAPLMVFRHGFRRGRADMLTVADSFAAAGMVTVAIDAAKHGDRSFCTPGDAGVCNGGGACTTNLPPGVQGDAKPPGTCGAAGFVKHGVNGSAGNPDGIPIVSGNYLVSANFFRTRDTMRQDLIDESQLIRALAFAPSGPPPQNHAVFDFVFARSAAATGHGLLIDPTTIYFSGQSLGAIQGAMDVAANPRISRAGFNVGGGTLVDVFTNSPAPDFVAATTQLLAGLGITRGTAQFLQFLVVAKTVLDPADPINFMGHLTANTLPNLLPPLGGNPDGSVPQAPKRVLVQVAHCDAVVPNPFNLIYANNAGASPLPLPGSTTFGGPGNFQLFVPSAPTSPADLVDCNANTAVEHGFLTDWLRPQITALAQSDLAKFVMSDSFLPPSIQHP